MFVQIIRGRTNDAAGLRRQLERWQQELAKGAKGYLGTTGGVADDGTAIFFARFESEKAARANSDRPEQGAWWAETEKYFDGDVTFRDSNDAELLLDGGSDDAGFVQVMQGRVLDRERVREIETKFMTRMRDERPDFIGGVRVWDNDEFISALYFKSEAEARKGEAALQEQEPDPEMAEFGSQFQDMSFIDLKDPVLQSA